MEKDAGEYKRKYARFRHHAWAGLGFLSVVLAIRIILPEYSVFLTPIIFVLIIVLIIYVFVALLFTYKYREGAAPVEESAPSVTPSVELEKAQLAAEIEKTRLKVEKKKAKTKAKAEKKKGK